MVGKRRRAVLFLFFCLFLVYGAHVVHEYKPFTWSHADPGWMVSTVMSIVEDRDLDLRNQLKNDPNQAVDQTSLGLNGQWYPLHEIVMPVLTVPFYILFGINGCLIFNVLISVLLMIVLFLLCARHVDYLSAFTAAALTAFPTLFLKYTYSYSLDVCATLLLILAFWCAVSRRFLLTGFVWALAIYARIPNVVTLAGLIPFLLLAGRAEIRTGEPRDSKGLPFILPRPLLLSLGGGLPVAACFLWMNWMMYGSPFITSYDRWQRFVNGEALLSSQRGAFSCSFFEKLPTVLLDPRSGLLIGGPLILLAIAFGTRTYWLKGKNEMIMATLVSGALLVLFAKYCSAFPGSMGNRYLMPIVGLSCIPLSLAISNCFNETPNPPT